MLDYLIVGSGLAGIAFSEQLERHGKSYTVISDGSQQASKVAGGLYNPVVLKRFTLAWNAIGQLGLAIPYYTHLEKKLGVKLNYPLPVYRRFASIEEQNLWFEAADNKQLGELLSTKIHPNSNPHIDAPFGYGEVLGTGRIDTKLLVASYREYLVEKGCFRPERFDYDRLEIIGNGVPSNTTNGAYVRYRTVESSETFEARHLVFAEGFGMKQNPFFRYLPMQGSKGEYLFIEAPELQEKHAIKSSIFVIPEGKDRYRIGANYAWKDKTNHPTEAARNELIKKLDALLRCDYRITGHVAGVRPTVSDRRPLVGRHHKFQNLYVLNGFGSRGVMIAPDTAGQLYRFIAKGDLIDPEIDISRFGVR